MATAGEGGGEGQGPARGTNRENSIDIYIQ